MTAVDKGKRRPREITGAMVLAGLLAFFGVVMVVNFSMARMALKTFAGVETESSYKAGLTFTKEAGAASEQAERHWAVDVDLQSPGGTKRVLEVVALDADGKPLSQLDADGRFSHPTDARRDVVLNLSPIGNGHYTATADVGPGQWDLVIDFSQGADRMFRSKNRVQLP